MWNNNSTQNTEDIFDFWDDFLDNSNDWKDDKNEMENLKIEWKINNTSSIKENIDDDIFDFVMKDINNETSNNEKNKVEGNSFDDKELKIDDNFEEDEIKKLYEEDDFVLKEKINDVNQSNSNVNVDFLIENTNEKAPNFFQKLKNKFKKKEQVIWENSNVIENTTIINDSIQWNNKNSFLDKLKNKFKKNNDSLWENIINKENVYENNINIINWDDLVIANNKSLKDKLKLIYSEKKSLVILIWIVFLLIIITSIWLFIFKDKIFTKWEIEIVNTSNTNNISKNEKENTWVTNNNSWVNIINNTWSNNTLSEENKNNLVDENIVQEEKVVEWNKEENIKKNDVEENVDEMILSLEKPLSESIVMFNSKNEDVWTWKIIDTFKNLSKVNTTPNIYDVSIIWLKNKYSINDKIIFNLKWILNTNSIDYKVQKDISKNWNSIYIYIDMKLETNKLISSEEWLINENIDLSDYIKNKWNKDIMIFVNNFPIIYEVDDLPYEKFIFSIE